MRTNVNDAGRAGFTVFISGTTTDFGPTRAAVGQELTARGYTVIEQSNLKNDGIQPLMRNLINSIRDTDVVIALVGPNAGYKPPGRAPGYFDQCRPPSLREPSYTQWEVLVAMKFGLPIYFVAANTLFDGKDVVSDPDQKLFVEHLKNENVKRKDYPSPADIPQMAAEWVDEKFSERPASVPRAVEQHLNSLRAFALTRLSRFASATIDKIDDINRELAFRMVRACSGPRNAADIGLPIELEANMIACSHDEDLPFRRMLVLAEPGDGKTTLVHWILSILARNRLVGGGMVPILADCVTLSRLMGEASSGDAEMVQAWLGIAVAPSGSLARANTDHVDKFLHEIRSRNWKLLIVVDGLDELDRDGQGFERVMRLFTAFDGWGLENDIKVEYFATSGRNSKTLTTDVYVRLADSIGIQSYELRPASHEQIEVLAAHHMPADTNLLDHFVQVFSGKAFEAKFVYFLPLIRFFKGHPASAYAGEVSNFELMRSEIGHIISSISKSLLPPGDARSGDAGLDAEIEHVLLDIALLSLPNFESNVPSNLSRRNLAARFDGSRLPALSDFMKSGRLVDRLLHILIYVSRDARDPLEAYYRLPHNDYRNYLLAAGIFQFISQKESLIRTSGEAFTAKLAGAYLSTSGVSSYFDDIVAAELGSDGSAARHDFMRKLVKLMNDGLPHLTPTERNVASPHGAMLSLLTRLGAMPARLEVKAAGVCFQGARIRGNGTDRIHLPLAKHAEAARFVEADLKCCDLSKHNLTGANFDNADLSGASLAGSQLTGANFRNVAMGRHGNLPTDLSGAQLDGSDWFNYRFALKGYFHFWDLEHLPETAASSRHVLASGSRGQLLVFEMGNAASQPAIVQTSHDNEVMDLSSHPSLAVLVCTSRDRTVRLFDLGRDDVAAGSTTLHERTDPKKGLVFDFAGYPRRAQFSTSGAWLALIARDPRVVFFSVDPQGNIGQPYAGYGHTGPVMCVVADPAPVLNAGSARSADTFLTAGYDGRVAVWREDLDRPELGWAQPSSMASMPIKTADQQTEILRALAPNVLKTGFWAGTELESRLLLFSFDGEAVELEITKAFPGSGGIFALAVNDAPSLLAAGCGNGRVMVFAADSNLPDAYDWDAPLLDLPTNGEIIRAAMFRSGGTRLLVATWDAHLFQFDLNAGTLEWYYEYPVENWQPVTDTGQIIFRPDDHTLDQAKGMSERMKTYLTLVNAAER
jgi:WD40 repeat protein